MFNRIGGVQQEIYPEGLHFRIPWFQYPIIYDIRFVRHFVRTNILKMLILDRAQEKFHPPPVRKIYKW